MQKIAKLCTGNPAAEDMVTDRSSGVTNASFMWGLRGTFNCPSLDPVASISLSFENARQSTDSSCIIM